MISRHSGGVYERMLRQKALSSLGVRRLGPNMVQGGGVRALGWKEKDVDACREEECKRWRFLEGMFLERKKMGERRRRACAVKGMVFFMCITSTLLLALRPWTGLDFFQAQ